MVDIIKGMEQRETSLEWENKVSEFIEENDGLLVEAGPASAERLLVHTKTLLTSLLNDDTAIAQELAQTLYKLADAINNPGTPPSAIMLLENKKDVLEAEHIAFVEIQQRMQDFHDAVQQACDKAHALSDEPGEPEKTKPSFWQRLFGKH